MVKIKYPYTCTTCGQRKTMILPITEEQEKLLEDGKVNLKELTDPGTFAREVFISSMCFECQEHVFNRPAPGHEEMWGEQKGECTVCGCRLYKKDIDADKCPSCKCVISNSEDYYEEEE